MELDHCMRASGEEIRNSLHRIQKTVDKGWPDDMVGVAARMLNTPKKLGKEDQDTLVTH